MTSEDQKKPRQKDDGPAAAGLRMFGLECAAPPTAPDFLAGFRRRRDEWRQRGVQAAAWRRLALPLAPLGAVAAIVVLALGIGVGGARQRDGVGITEETLAGYRDPLAVGFEEAGARPMVVDAEEPGFELVAALYLPGAER